MFGFVGDDLNKCKYFNKTQRRDGETERRRGVIGVKLGKIKV